MTRKLSWSWEGDGRCLLISHSEDNERWERYISPSTPQYIGLVSPFAPQFIIIWCLQRVSLSVGEILSVINLLSLGWWTVMVHWAAPLMGLYAKLFAICPIYG